jgi:hypothetical protein
MCGMGMRDGLKANVSSSDEKRVAMSVVDGKHRVETDFTEIQSQATVLFDRQQAEEYLELNRHKEVRESTTTVRGE